MISQIRTTEIYKHRLLNNNTAAHIQTNFLKNRNVEVVIDIVIGAAGHGFDIWTCETGCSVANGSPPPQSFFEAVWPRRQASKTSPAIRYMLRRNTASFMNILNEKPKLQIHYLDQKPYYLMHKYDASSNLIGQAWSSCKQNLPSFN